MLVGKDMSNLVTNVYFLVELMKFGKMENVFVNRIILNLEVFVVSAL